jgi:hypothetical protein
MIADAMIEYAEFTKNYSAGVEVGQIKTGSSNAARW